MIYQFTSYIKFIRKATNHHGVHSPFVYDLVTRCFYDTSKYPAYAILKKYRKLLLQEKSAIEITDFGQGSRVFKNNRRPVNAIAKHAGIRLKRQKLLYRLTHYLKPDAVLELGTSLGLSTIAMSLGNPAATITTIEGCPNTAQKAKQLFGDFKAENIHIQNLSFDRFFEVLSSEKYHLVYVDGNHHKESTLLYFHQLLATAENDSVFIFDDIYWSASMTEAWQEISAHPEVTVSIDTFYWGLVFFRKEQKKQHFTIRL